MKMSLTVDGLLSDVAAIGELGDDEVAEVAERIATVLTRSLPTRILDVLSEMAGELSRSLSQSRVDIRLDGDDIEFVVVDEAPLASDAVDADLSARITLRLSEQLKARVEEKASDQGLSVNAWVLRALDRAASASPGNASSHQGNGRAGTRLRGFGTS